MLAKVSTACSHPVPALDTPSSTSRKTPPDMQGAPQAKGISSQAQHRLLLVRISSVSCSPVFQVCLLTLSWGRKAHPAPMEAMPSLLGKQAKGCVVLRMIIFTGTFYLARWSSLTLEVIKLAWQGRAGVLKSFLIPCDSRNDQQRGAKQKHLNKCRVTVVMTFPYEVAANSHS